MAVFFSIRRGSSVVATSSLTPAMRAWRWPAALLICLALGGVPRAAHGGTLVNFNTQLGSIQIDLFDDVVPETVANFLSYVNSGAYSNTLVHRSTSLADTGLAVIQGGGYTYNSQSGSAVHIATSSPVNLQYVLNNARGTIAMARTAAINSATSEWFINTSDNSTVLGPNNGGGYAVFGWVVGTGMSVADTINTLPKTAFGGIPSNVPLKNWTPPAVPTESNLVLANSITVMETHPSFQNPILSTDVNNDTRTTPNDALIVINSLLAAGGSHAASASFLGTTYRYFDPSGNGVVSPQDALIVINALLSQDASPAASPLVAPQAAPLSALLAAPMFSVVPEPSSLALAATALLALSACAWGRLRRQSARSAS